MAQPKGFAVSRAADRIIKPPPRGNIAAHITIGGNPKKPSRFRQNRHKTQAVIAHHGHGLAQCLTFADAKCGKLLASIGYKSHLVPNRQSIPQQHINTILLAG